MSSTIIIKNSATSGSVPASLVQGEFGINVTDGKLYYGSGSTGTVKEFNSSSYAVSASYALSSSYAVSASYALQSTTSSNSLTASYLNPLNQTVLLTGSLSISGSEVITGSLAISGSGSLLSVQGDEVTISGDLIELTGSMKVSGSISLDNYTQGSVLFIGSNRVISQDNSNLFWNDVTNRLSIGTSTTTASLYLKGPSNTASDTIFRAENSSSTSQFVVDGNGNTTISAIQNTSTTYFSAGDTTIGPVISVTCDGNVRSKFLNIHHNQSNTIIGKIGSGDNVLYLGITGIIPSNTNQARSNILFTGQGYDNGGSFFEFATTTAAGYGTPSGGNPAMLKVRGSIGGNASGIFSWADFVGTINQTGGTSPTIGLHYRPTVTAITGSHYGLLIRPATFNGINMGSTRYPSSSLHVVANTTGSVFLVENQSSASIFNIQNDGTGSYNGPFIVTGSFTVTTGSKVEFQVLDTGVKIGDLITDAHTVTGSINISGSISASNANFGTITATSGSITYLTTIYETSSIIYSSGSNQFGDASDDVQTLWGTIDIKTGPVLVTGSMSISGSLNAPSITGSLFGTASWANNAITASYALTASSALNAQDILIYVKNVTGTQINKGTVVRISGATGDNALISTASYENDNNSANTLGITNQNIPNDSFGYVITEGKLIGIDTSTFTAGQLLFLGPTGSIIGTAPVAPLHGVRLGQVLRVQSNNGSMYVRIDNGYELGELHDVVDTTTTASYGDLLVKSGSVWTNSKQLTGSYSITGSLTISGSSTFTNIGTTNLTGSVNITGSTTQIGTNTLIGNTSLSGSLIISGSQGAASHTIEIFGDINQTGYTRFLPVTTNIDTSISASYIYVSGSTQDLYFSQNSKGYNNVTRLRWLEGNLYTGLLNGGVITSQSATIYQVSSGSGIIVDLNASLNDNPYPTVQYLNWGNLSASIAPFTASYQQCFVGIDSTNNIFAQAIPFTNGQFDTIINIGNVLFQNGSTINGFKTQPSTAYGFEQAQNIFNRAFGPLKLSGYTLSPSGSSTGSLVVGSGTSYAPGANYITNPNEPYYVIDSGTNVSKIFRYRQSGSTWIYDTNAGAGYPTIDPTRYSNNGVLTAVPAPVGNNWTIQRVFYFPSSVTKAIVVYYGNNYYGSESEALANIPFESFVEAPNTAANAIYLGAIVINGNGVFTNANTFTIYPAGLFRQVGGSGGGGSTVTTTLSGLSDVNISGPTNGQALIYNSTALKWENSSFFSGSISGNAATATTASFASSGTGTFSGSFSGSFQGNGSGLTNIPASGITGLNLSQIATGSVSASVSPGTASFQITSGSTNFLFVSSSGNIGIGTTTPTSAKLQVSGSTSALGLQGSGSGVFTVDGTSGRLFSVDDSLSGSLFSVNTAAGLPLIEAFSDNTVRIGQFGQRALFVSQSKVGIGKESALNGILDVSGSVTVTGSVIATSFTGSLLGTASLATTASYVLNAVSASFATTASYVLNAVSASFASTASSVNPLNQNVVITGSLTVITGSSIELQVTNTGVKIGNASTDTHTVTGSLQVAGQTRISGSFNTAVSGTILTVIGSGSTQPIFTVQGSQGELFSVTDSLSGSLFSVNDISGLPILEVFSDSTTNIGNYLAPAVYTTNKITQTNSGSFVVYSLPTASYDGAFYDYTVRSGSNARAGQIMAIWSGSSVNFTETTTTSFGSTSAIGFTVIVSGSNMVLTGSSATGSWTIKTIIRSI